MPSTSSMSKSTKNTTEPQKKQIEPILERLQDKLDKGQKTLFINPHTGKLATKTPPPASLTPQKRKKYFRRTLLGLNKPINKRIRTGASPISFPPSPPPPPPIPSLPIPSSPVPTSPTIPSRPVQVPSPEHLVSEHLLPSSNQSPQSDLQLEGYNIPYFIDPQGDPNTALDPWDIYDADPLERNRSKYLSIQTLTTR